MSAFRLEVEADSGKGATVTVYDTDHDPHDLVLYRVTVNVCDEQDGMRRALTETARFLSWYLDPR